MKPLLFELEPNLPLFAPMLQRLGAEAGLYESRRFPDGETYLRIDSDIRGRPCLILANLAKPDDKFLQLVFLAETLKELGATSVGLVAPYLCYMRQDRRFTDGEALTSRIFARLISDTVNWLVTIDPHLHRYHSLGEIYAIPAVAVHGASALADWLALQTEDLLLVGPDAESEQWVAAIAQHTGHPFVVGEKQRRGDRDVTVTLPDLKPFHGYTAVVIDDVISSGHTLMETVSALKTAGFDNVDCVAVHGIFAGSADDKLHERGVRQLITANSIPHPSNTVDISGLLCEAISEQLTKSG